MNWRQMSSQDYAAERVLRFLLFRFRVAKFRIKLHLADLKRHRWVWFGMEEMARATGLEKRHLQKVRKRLEQRRLRW